MNHDIQKKKRLISQQCFNIIEHYLLQHIAHETLTIDTN